MRIIFLNSVCIPETLINQRLTEIFNKDNSEQSKLNNKCVALLDLSRAFTAIHDELLIIKLHSMGSDKNRLELLDNF